MDIDIILAVSFIDLLLYVCLEYIIMIIKSFVLGFQGKELSVNRKSLKYYEKGKKFKERRKHNV